MANKVLQRRGLKANLPTLDVGELGLAVNTGELFIGTPGGNVLVNVMTSTDKTKLNGIATGATANTGTVTNVSASTTQVSGLTLLISNATSTPTIATAITNEENFRTAIGAGTSNLRIGTTASTAKAGNYQPTIAQVTGLTAALQDAGRVKLLRARSGTSALTAYNNATVTGVGSQLERGDTIMFEVHTASTITSATPKILTATVSSTANSTSEARSITFTTWTGSIMKVYSLSVSRTSAGLLNFSSMNVMTMSKSSSNMNIINSSWTAYIGRIWKVDGSVI